MHSSHDTENYYVKAYGRTEPAERSLVENILFKSWIL